MLEGTILVHRMLLLVQKLWVEYNFLELLEAQIGIFCSGNFVVCKTVMQYGKLHTF